MEQMVLCRARYVAFVGVTTGWVRALPILA